MLTRRLAPDPGATVDTTQAEDQSKVKDLLLSCHNNLAHVCLALNRNAEAEKNVSHPRQCDVRTCHRADPLSLPALVAADTWATGHKRVADG